MNLSFNDKVSILNSTLNNVNLNSTTYFNIEHDVMNNIKANQTDIYKAEELSGAYSYKLIPENVTVIPSGIELQLWVENHAGIIVDNRNLVYEMYKNLTTEMMNINSTNHVNFKLISYNSRYMVLEIYLTKAQIKELQSGANDTLLQIFAPFDMSSIPNVATGTISPAVATIGVSSIWLTLGFSTSPPPWTGIDSIPAYITWIFYNAGGRAITGIVAIATLIYFAYMINKKDKKTKRTKRQVISDKKIDLIYDKVVGDEDE
jgi:hypothetical protein